MTQRLWSSLRACLPHVSGCLAALACSQRQGTSRAVGRGQKAVKGKGQRGRGQGAEGRGLTVICYLCDAHATATRSHESPRPDTSSSAPEPGQCTPTLKPPCRMYQGVAATQQVQVSDPAGVPAWSCTHASHPPPNLYNNLNNEIATQKQHCRHPCQPTQQVV